MITPPVVITVAFIGYLVAGPPALSLQPSGCSSRASGSSSAAFIPALKAHRGLLVDGVTAEPSGRLLSGDCARSQSHRDVPTALIAGGLILALVKVRRVLNRC
jgi:hypothetical protein